MFLSLVFSFPPLLGSTT